MPNACKQNEVNIEWILRTNWPVETVGVFSISGTLPVLTSGQFIYKLYLREWIKTFYPWVCPKGNLKYLYEALNNKFLWRRSPSHYHLNYSSISLSKIYLMTLYKEDKNHFLVISSGNLSSNLKWEMHDWWQHSKWNKKN